MSKALYNPKYVTLGGSKKINTTDVKRFVWSHAFWNLKVNEIKKFSDDVGEAMLRHMEFLVEVTPKNIEEIKKIQAEHQFHCSECTFTTDTKVAFFGHVKSHGLTEEHTKMLGEIEEAQPSKKFYGINKSRKLTPEEQEGLPDTSSGPAKDKDGIEFYGGGLEEDK